MNIHLIHICTHTNIYIDMYICEHFQTSEKSLRVNTGVFGTPVVKTSSSEIMVDLAPRLNLPSVS
jgi:hypothetical protein